MTRDTNNLFQYEIKLSSAISHFLIIRLLIIFLVTLTFVRGLDNSINKEIKDLSDEISNKSYDVKFTFLLEPYLKERNNESSGVIRKKAKIKGLYHFR